MSVRRPSFQAISVLIVLLAGIAGAWAIIGQAPQIEVHPPAREVPLVDVIRVRPQSVSLNVYSQGVVKARTKIDLAAEVAGKIVDAHPELAAGGFFRKGEILLMIDPRDYDLAITEALAAVAEAERRLAEERARARQAEREWKALGNKSQAPSLTLRLPYVAEAQAKLQGAEAALANARLQRSRCELRAPFDGRVDEKFVGIGQYVEAGDKLARVYAIDVAEVRLPVPVEQLGYLVLPLNRNTPDEGPRVVLTAELGGSEHRWEGRIVRSESGVDESNGLLHLIAEIREPYSEHYPQPLLAGLYVKAEIEGRLQDDVYVLPRTAVNVSQQVMLVDTDERLRIEQLKVLRTETDRVLVKGGLAANDQVVVGGIDIPVAGMRVRINDSEQNEMNQPAAINGAS